MVDQIAPTVILSGQTLVAVPGTQVTLGIGTTIRSVVIRAHATNTQNIYVGPAAVAAATGYILAPGESVALAINLRSTPWIDADVGGEGVSYIAVI